MPETKKHLFLDFIALAWRLAVYFAVLIAGFKLFSMAYGWAIHRLGVHFTQSPGVKPAEAVGLAEARRLLAAALAWFITARLGRDRLSPIVPLHARAAAHLLQGVLWGLAEVAATLGLIACFGGYQVSGLDFSGRALSYYLPLWLAVAVVNGIAENLAVMGYPLFRLARTTGWVPAILLLGLFFAVAHMGNTGENPLGIASVFIAGVLFGTTIWLTGDLWLSIGIHAGSVLAEDLIFSVPDSGMVYTGHLLVSQLRGPAWLSGGDAGPEGSVFQFVIYGVLLALLWIIYRRRPAGAPIRNFATAPN